jgi:4-hydroxy-3-methylbut-2-enyl diphosphate reductase
MKVLVARHAGVCYGVERALKLANEAADSGRTVRTLGPLIHNPQAVEALHARGIEVAACLADAEDGTLVIRTHGVRPEIIGAARDKGLDVVDATCPFVSAAHQCAARLASDGYFVVIVGEPDHPEVEGILGYAGLESVVVEELGDIPAKLPRRVGVVVQTTQSMTRLTEVVTSLLPRVSELKVCNTICDATDKRQESAQELAGSVDVVIVVGGHNSGNTTRLAEISRNVNPRTYHVETAEELDPAWFSGAETVGVTAGASTPDAQMRGVVEAIERLGSGVA